MKKVFFHIDVNSAYLSWEAARRVKLLGESEDLRNMTVVIGGDQSKRHGIVLAKSQPAKKMGIKTGESLMSARKKCPGLIVVPPDFSLYVKASDELIRLLRTISPDVLQYSIDEAFVDMTGTERLYGSPVVAANYLREKIKNELGFTVNIGVSENKLLAKMAGDFKKPDLVHTLFKDEIEEKLWPLPVGDLFFVGRKTQRRLLNMGLTAIGDVAKCDVRFLERHFKKHGRVIWENANGIENFGFDFEEVKNRGYGNSTTMAYDVNDREIASFFILSLCETLCSRLREDNMKIRVVSLSLTDSYFDSVSRQRSLSLPTNVTNEIYANAMSLFDELWSGEPLRRIGVHTSKAEVHRFEQLSLFDEANMHSRLSDLDSTVDEIRRRYGEGSVKRACFLDSEIRHMGGGIAKDRQTGIIRPERIDLKRNDNDKK